MSQLTKQQLGIQNSTSFPNNTTGYITPELLRNFNTDMIDSTVNQTVYTADSTSFDSRVDSLESFSSSLSIDYINQNELNTATQSLSASLTTTINTKLNITTFNSFSSSLTQSIIDLQNSKANLNGGNNFTGSQNIDGSITASVTIVAGSHISASGNITASGFVSASGLGIRGNSTLGGNAFDNTTIKGTLYVPNTFVLNSISWSIYSASIFSSSVFNQNVFVPFSQSAAFRLNQLEVWSSSLDTGFVTEAELAAVSSSLKNSINQKLDTSSFNTFSSSITNTFASSSSSFDSRIDSLEAFSSSQYKNDSSSFDGRVDLLESTASYLNTTFSQSVDSRLDNEEFKSTTFATTGSNNFFGNQEVVGAIQASDAIVPPSYLAPTVFQGVGTTAVAYDQFVNAGNYDALHIETQLNNGTLFQDLDPSNFTFNTWLEIPGNGGANPSPQFKRGLFVSSSLISSGSTTITGSLNITGSTTISGSVKGWVNVLTVSSNTASIDCSRGNFFTLSIPQSTITHISASNIQPGQTITVKLTQGATTGSLRYEPNFNFSSGSVNIGTPVANAIDVLTFVTFDSSELYCSIAKNLV